MPIKGVPKRFRVGRSLVILAEGIFSTLRANLLTIGRALRVSASDESVEMLGEFRLGLGKDADLLPAVLLESLSRTLVLKLPSGKGLDVQGGTGVVRAGASAANSSGAYTLMTTAGAEVFRLSIRDPAGGAGVLLTSTEILELRSSAGAGTPGGIRVSGISSYFELPEMVAPVAPGVDFVRLYAKDNGAGKTQLMALFATGAEQVIATQP